MAKSPKLVPPGFLKRAVNAEELNRAPTPYGKLTHATICPIATHIEDLTQVEIKQRQAAMFGGGHA